MAAVERQMRRGITHMLPTEDAIAAGEELTRRFGLPLWQFTMTATDANRFSIRLARRITGRPKIVVHDHCYHGSVDETLATLDRAGAVVATDLNIGPPVDPALTSRVVPFNDVDALDRALAGRGLERQAAAFVLAHLSAARGGQALEAMIPRGDAELFQAVVHGLGYLLGDALDRAHRAGRISPAGVRTLFRDPFDDATGVWRALCADLLR
jgi:hypothetical protein